MRKPSATFILSTFLILICGVVLNKYVLKDKLAGLVLASIKTPAAYIFDKSSLLGNIAGQISKFRQLANENDRLRQENQKLVSQAAEVENLQAENNFLKKAAGINNKFNYPTISANVFSVSLGILGYDTILNKGRSESIKTGDVVITSEGILLGTVREVFDHISKIAVITDASFSTTARILGSDTRGIAKGNLDKGIFLDLVAQDDPVNNDDVVVTSGDDLIPPALILGKIYSIKADGKSVFKQIWAKPAFKNIIWGRVLIIKVHE